ncbi:NAD(P)/FAD-dependent oxidoreductase [Amycolatopsis sp. H20-H5]|uniref:NAD(P)/FAD-dependent oxidoreductase n=1 Tax=Amycolatopsis sp. H20-H5 TaxID=3046309 RepID=UPI002DBBED3A|nr:FAD-binding oxidoreductase [Amycolatopsis sp. H20-H5]MEC3981049.1 FAD-binding oxidoreductase [Amycolatopsis sp. H20-H5]
MITVGVIGAGAIGSCVALSLAQRGVRVHCVDRGRPGGLTTDVSFARLSAYQQPTYQRFELSHTGIMEHTHFAGQFASAPWRHPTGSLAWAGSEGTCGVSARPFVAEIERLQSWGYRISWRDAAKVNQELEPAVSFSPTQTPVALLPEEGWIDGPGMVSSVLDAARSIGELTFTNAAVREIEVRGERVVALRLDNGERIEVDAVVNAAGPRAPAVAASLGAPMLRGIADRSSLVIDLVVDGDPLRHVLRGAELHARPAGPGRVRVRSEQVDSVLTGETESDLGRDNVEDLLGRAYRTIPALKASTVDQKRIGTAVFPADGMPSVGPLSTVPGYYEAFANSGVILAPFIGRTLATQIFTGEVHSLLRDCSPDRLRLAA